jgi:hypothetical protein
LNGAKVQAKLEAHSDKVWSLNEMERSGGEPDVVGHDKSPARTFFMIARRRVRKAVEVFATTAKGWIREKKINQKVARLIWQLV